MGIIDAEAKRTAYWLDGKALAQQLETAQIERAVTFTRRCGRMPGLAIIQIGEDAASTVYVRHKLRKAERVGLRAAHYRLGEQTSQQQAIECIAACNADPHMDAILLQLPLPPHLLAQPLTATIAPSKDADGLHPHNLGQLFVGLSGPKPCTPLGIMRLLAAHEVDVRGKLVVVVGRGLLVGRPLAVMLGAAGATVCVCHSETRDLAAITRQADILVVATGVAGLVGADMVKKDVVIVDVGIHPRPSGIVGDVDGQGMEQVAAHATPVPGGVGPMTVAMLIENTLDLAFAALIKPG